MKRKLWLAAGIIGLVGFAASSAPFSRVEANAAPAAPAPTTPVFIMQSTTYGVVAVDQTSGAITFCDNRTTVPQPTGGMAMAATCMPIGKVTPTATSVNSLSLTPSGSIVFVSNNLTGEIAECGGSDVSGVGQVQLHASCKALGNLASK